MQTITRKGSFDAMHRVMNEKFKCNNIHGHTYLYELEFRCDEFQDIGYTIDFKEIKRVACQWIDDHLDHAAILNPLDEVMKESCRVLGSKFWIMGLNYKGADVVDNFITQYCNPTVENISKEVFIAIRLLMRSVRGLHLHSVTIYETPNCFTKCTSVVAYENDNWIIKNGDKINEYIKEKGTIEYDDRKPTSK